jgi:hypothetical protein
MGCLRECVWTVAAIPIGDTTRLNIVDSCYAAQPNHISKSNQKSTRTEYVLYYDIYADSEVLVKNGAPTIMVRRERLFILS